MATSSSEQKPTLKESYLIPSSFISKNPYYAGYITVQGKAYTTEWFDNKDEALLELRCLEKQLGYELIKTMRCEGFYPERARIIEEKYQASGRTNGLYTGLNMSDGKISDNVAS
jgi:hypothetical protein